VYATVSAIGDLLDAHSGAVSAAATIIIAAFTIVLALVTARQARLTRQLAESTEIAAKAARDSATTIPTLERAYLFVETQPRCLIDLEQRVRSVKETGNDYDTAQRRSSVDFRIKNHGKTPAVAKAHSWTLQYRIAGDSASLLAAEPAGGTIVIAAGEAHPRDRERFLGASLDRPLGLEEIQRIANGAFVLLFAGRITYDDIFGNEHETRVCLRFDPDTGGLVEYGGAEWNQRT
jgi:hypothetical protein